MKYCCLSRVLCTGNPWLSTVLNSLIAAASQGMRSLLTWLQKATLELAGLSFEAVNSVSGLVFCCCSPDARISYVKGH